MTTIVISNSYPYGQMTNQTMGKLIAMHSTMQRLNDAIATASAGYEGEPGTQFEIPSAIGGAPPTLFGVQPSATPGEQGTDYRYAMDALATQWATFWAAAEPFIEQLDNGTLSI